MDYYYLQNQHKSARDPVKGKPMGNNRRAVYVSYVPGAASNVDAYGYKLHNTVVVTFTSDTRMILDNGGYHSVTSKKAINEALPSGFCLYQKKYEWYLKCPNGDVLEYENGMVVYLDAVRQNLYN